MAHKVMAVVGLLAFANAGFVQPNYSPATSVSYSSFSTGPDVARTVAASDTIIATPLAYSKSYIEPAPIYESSAEDQKLRSLNPNTFDSIYNTYKNYDISSARDGGLLTHSVPYDSSLHGNPITYNSQSDYSASSPIFRTISAPSVAKSQSIPVAYPTHSSPITNTISLPFANSLTGYSKTPGLSTYASHVSDVPVKSITYSEAPIVSHMSFSGLGTSYAW